MLNLPLIKIILFDGVCNLCNSAVLFIIKRFKRCFPVCGSAIKVGQKFVTTLASTPIKWIVLFCMNGLAYYYKSEAALKIGSQLGFSIPCPLFLNYTCKGTESFYDYIARYRWFGKKDQCMIPTKELNAKFLE
jgi:predicted DCC family thiol-disulfide oxidoreductase YuxK